MTTRGTPVTIEFVSITEMAQCVVRERDWRLALKTHRRERKVHIRNDPKWGYTKGDLLDEGSRFDTRHEDRHGRPFYIVSEWPGNQTTILLDDEEER